jgi:hypothetical protein
LHQIVKFQEQTSSPQLSLFHASSRLVEPPHLEAQSAYTGKPISKIRQPTVTIYSFIDPFPDLKLRMQKILFATHFQLSIFPHLGQFLSVQNKEYKFTCTTTTLKLVAYMVTYFSVCE